MNQQRVYCGLFDDFAIRARDGRSISSVDDLNAHLVSAVICGDSLAINDGYLLMNQGMRDAISQADLSPLKPLAKKGFVQILTRNGGSLSSLADFMANQNISSAQQLLNEAAYRTAFLPQLEAWDAEIRNRYDCYRAWPNKQTNEVFKRLTSRILDQLSHSQIIDGEDLRKFRDTLGDRIGSRTAWEDESMRLEQGGTISNASRTILLAVANEAYQYSWGCLLYDDINPVGVQMRSSRFLTDLTLVEGQGSAARSDIKVFVPNEAVITKGVKTQWDKLAELLDSGNPARESKALFRESLAKYYADDVAVNTKDMQGIAKDYSQCLAKHFGKDRIVDTGAQIMFGAAAVAAPAFLLGPPGIVIGAAITGGGILAGSVFGVRNLIRRVGQTKPGGWITQLDAKEYQRSISSFQLDPAKVAPITKGIPPFREED
jgi:hypothetical protein